MTDEQKDAAIADLNIEANQLREALWAILRWDIDNLIPDELHKQAIAAIKPQSPCVENAGGRQSNRRKP